MPTLKAKIAGAWVPISSAGADEVYVGTTAPTDPNIELWYDTDELNPQTAIAAPSSSVPVAPTVTGTIGTASTYARADHTHPRDLNVAQGFVARHALTTQFTTTGTHTTFQADGLQVVVNEPVGRIWRISWQFGAIATGGVNGMYGAIHRNAVELQSFFMPPEAIGASGTALTLLWSLIINPTAVGSGVIYETKIRGINNTAVSSWAAAWSPRYLMIEDIGPVTRT